MSLRFYVAIALGLLLSWRAIVPTLFAADEQRRTWTDITGQLKTEATFLDFKDGRVRFRRIDGTEASIALEKLSPNDQQYVQDRAAQPIEEAGRTTTSNATPGAAQIPATSESWIGKQVVLRPGVALRVAGGNAKLDPEVVGPLPWKVSQVKGEWLWIGKTWVKKSEVRHIGDFEPDQNLLKFSDLVRKEPQNAWHYMNRSFFWANLDDSLTDLNDALRIDPKNDYIRGSRAHLHEAKGRWEQALADYNEAIRTNPESKSTQLLESRATLLSACPEARVRNGRQAIADATKACEMTTWEWEGPLGALAAACAETGDFANAVKWQTKAVEAVKKNNSFNKEYVKEYEQRLDLYRQNKPYRIVRSST